jgi:hypothetical protein
MKIVFSVKQSEFIRMQNPQKVAVIILVSQVSSSPPLKGLPDQVVYSLILMSYLFIV